MFSNDLYFPSLKVFTEDKTTESIVMKLCTNECWEHFIENAADPYSVCLDSSDIIEYYLTKPNLTLSEKKLVKEYLDHVISFTDQDIGSYDRAMDSLKHNISNKMLDDFLKKLNPITKKYFLDDIVEAIKAGASYE